MSPNANYLAGVRIERLRLHYWKALNHAVIRASGSHGLFDLVTVSPQGRVQLIQVKRVQAASDAARLMRKWKESPPLPDLVTNQFIQVLEVSIKAERGQIVSCFV